MCHNHTVRLMIIFIEFKEDRKQTRFLVLNEPLLSKELVYNFIH